MAETPAQVMAFCERVSAALWIGKASGRAESVAETELWRERNGILGLKVSMPRSYATQAQV